MKLHHYKSVRKSDFLASSDLEEIKKNGGSLVFTIHKVEHKRDVNVAGKKGDFNIAYFKENIKPLVLNMTNCEMISRFNGGEVFVENWKNTMVELYVDNRVIFGKETVKGIRIMPKQPTNEPDYAGIVTNLLQKYQPENATEIWQKCADDSKNGLMNQQYIDALKKELENGKA